jgi:tetratricopeptide (TPR) repeat protein
MPLNLSTPVLALLFGCALAGWSITAANAGPEPRGHTVKQILRDGQQVASADGVAVTPPGGKPEATIRQGESIVDGTRVDVPAHLVVVIVSTGAKSTITLNPGSSLTFISTGSGEYVSSNGGHVGFSVVPGSLDFFHVQSGESLNASVHGTEFSIDADQGNVTFDCTRGEVGIQKTGYLLVGEKSIDVTLSDVISAVHVPSVTYQPQPTWYFAKFANFAEADAFYEAQLVTAQHSGSQAAVAAALFNVGIVELRQGSYVKALPHLQQAYAITQATRDRVGEGRVLTTIAFAQGKLGNYPGALDSSNRAIEIARDVNDLFGEAVSLNGIGTIEYEQGRLVDALQSFRQAFALEHELKNVAGEAYDLAQIGNAEQAMGQFADGLSSEQQALAVLQQIGDRQGEAQLRLNIGIVEGELGRNADGLQSVKDALAISRDLGARDDEAWELNNMGRLEQALGHVADALADYQQSLALYQALGDRMGEGRATMNVGRAEADQGRASDALQSLQQGLAIERSLGDTVGALRDLMITGEVQGNQGQYANALQSFQQAAALAHQTSDRGDELAALRRIAHTQAVQHRYPDALATLQQALTVAQQMDKPDEITSINADIATLRTRMNSSATPAPIPASTPS